MSSLSQVLELAAIARDSRYTATIDICAFTVLIYDYLITFSEEIELIWSMPFRAPAKTLFLLTRYLPFVDMTICMTNHFMQHLTAESCRISVHTMGWLIISGLLFSEAILTLRTWAVWDRSRVIGAGLAIWYTITFVPIFTIMGLFLKSMTFTNPELPNCLPVADRPLDSAAWILLVVLETGISIPMVVKAVQKCRLPFSSCLPTRNISCDMPDKLQGGSSLYRIVYLDGSLYYLYLLVLSTLNIICILRFPEGTKRILTNFERVIHSVLTERILLSIRSLAKKGAARQGLQGGRPDRLYVDGFDTDAGSRSSGAANSQSGDEM
ncbi:hypothetical protein ACEPAF_8116 [Sanghuangporus sanghuang]